MKYKLDLRSEDGAAYVLEATIVYPIVLVATLFLIILGFTHVQKALLQHEATELSTYIAKVIRFPGYALIDQPFYMEDSAITLDGYNSAMEEIKPYRYLFNMNGDFSFGDDSKGEELLPKCAKEMVQTYLVKHGFLKGDERSIPTPEIASYNNVQNEVWAGRRCVISANSSRVVVYLGQDFVLSNMFRMIGLGNKKLVLSGQCTSYVCDSVEIVRITDMAFDLIDFLAGKLNFDLEKITDSISKITGNSGK